MPATQNPTIRINTIRVHNGSRRIYDRMRCGLNCGKEDDMVKYGMVCRVVGSLRIALSRHVL